MSHEPQGSGRQAPAVDQTRTDRRPLPRVLAPLALDPVRPAHGLVQPPHDPAPQPHRVGFPARDPEFPVHNPARPAHGLEFSVRAREFPMHDPARQPHEPAWLLRAAGRSRQERRCAM